MTENKINVLVIDDEEEDFLLLQALFNAVPEQDIDLTWVTGRSEALDALNRVKLGYDVCLLDYMLGEEDSIELLQFLNETYPELPCILITATVDRNIDLEAMKIGAMDCLSKDSLSGTLLERSVRYARERKRHEMMIEASKRELTQLTQYDALTGVTNRKFCFFYLAGCIARAEHHQHQMAVLLVNLNFFKKINLRVGHRGGDLILQYVAEKLSSLVRKEDVVARVGGDEFAILLDLIPNPEYAGRVAQDVLKVFEEPLIVEGESFFVTTSVGISLYPDCGETPDALLKTASIALRQIERRGKSEYLYYSKAQHEASTEKIRLEYDLRSAKEKQELLLYYQPQVNAQTSEVIGMEALLRWQHPKYGLIAPNQFIPIAEEAGLILSLGEWVLYAACAQNHDWDEHMRLHLSVAVNVSLKQLQMDNFWELLNHTLQTSKLEPESLEIELTESTLMENPEKIIDLLHQIHDLGVRIAIDDFGTGYSSLSYLTRLPIDIIKIDQSFVQNIGLDSNDETVIKSIIAMAKNMDLEVIAEGVETQTQAEFLKNVGCDILQGYYFSKPLTLEDAANLLLKMPPESNMKISQPPL